MSLLPNSSLEDTPSGTGNLTAIFNGNWRAIDNWVNPATGFTAAQAGTTVTASAVIFTSENIGDTIRFAGGQEAMIVATAGTVASPSSQCVVATSRNVSSAAFNIYAYLTPAASGTGSQTATTVTATVAVFTNLHEGGTILFSGGQICVIQSTSGTVGSPSTTCVVAPPQSVSSSSFTIFKSAAQSPRTALARALTKKTKAESIPAGTSFVWNATRQQFEPRSAEPAPYLFMNVRIAGVNASISNSISLGRLTGRDTGASLIAAGTVIDGSQIHFEWIGTNDYVSGTFKMGVSFKEFGGNPIQDFFDSVNLFASGCVKLKGVLRFTGPQNAMLISGSVIFESTSYSVNSAVKRLLRINSANTYDFTANREFNITGQFSVANVSNAIFVETFWLKHIINAN